MSVTRLVLLVETDEAFSGGGDSDPTTQRVRDEVVSALHDCGAAVEVIECVEEEP